MAVSFATTTSSASETDASSYATASVTPTANKLQLLAIVSRHGSTTPNTPTASGNSLTWVAIANVHFDTSGSQRKLTLLRAMGSSPTTGTITIDFASQTQSGCTWDLVEVTGADTSGTNGSGAIIQSKTNADTGGTATGLTVTLDAAITSTLNAVFATFAVGDGTLSFTPGSGFTELSDHSVGAEANIKLQTMYDAAGADTTADVALTGGDGNSEIGGIAIEIKNAVTVALTGTATASITEADIVTGGKTIILTITGDTWIAAGAGSFDLQRDEIIAGIDSAQSEATGWDLVPKALQSLGGVVRTSDTIVTLTLDAFATYNITATETITATIPSTALVGAGGNVVATPTFAITAVASGSTYPGYYGSGGYY